MHPKYAPSERLCRVCKRLLPRNEFDTRYLSNGRSNGLKLSCRECDARPKVTAVNTPEKFWQLVDQSEGPDACWLWKGTTFHPDGYGQWWINGRNVRCHRFAWELTHGELPKALDVCHECDNPPCCNPGHLFPGTRAENNADMEAKGRAVHVVGIAHPAAKLSEDDVRTIRADFAAGVSTTRELASRFGLRQTYVYDIIHRRNWKHVT